MISEAFPLNIKDEVAAVMNVIPKATRNNVSVGVSGPYLEYKLKDRYIKIPCRVYYKEILNEVYSTLNAQQKLIAHCIYTRHCDGFVRERDM